VQCEPATGGGLPELNSTDEPSMQGCWQLWDAVDCPCGLVRCLYTRSRCIPIGQPGARAQTRLAAETRVQRQHLAA
jgi:hypothetical protein